MKFNKAKGNPQHRYSLGDKGIGSSPVEKDLGVLGNEKLNTGQPIVAGVPSKGAQPPREPLVGCFGGRCLYPQQEVKLDDL